MSHLRRQRLSAAWRWPMAAPAIARPRATCRRCSRIFSLARPTMASLVPRVCELFYHHYLARGGPADRRRRRSPEVAEQDVKREMREKLLGGRLLSVGCGSASLAPETYAFMESMLDMHMPIGYSSTEIAGGTVLVDWKVQRPPVIDYKLDRRSRARLFQHRQALSARRAAGEDRSGSWAAITSDPSCTAEKVDAEGFYRTGDVMAEHRPRSSGLSRPAQQCGQAVAGRVRRGLAAGGALRAQPGDPADLSLRQQRARVPARRRGARPRNCRRELGRGRRAADKVKAAIRRSLQQIAEENELQQL